MPAKTFKRLNSSMKLIDLVGQRFGRLVVIERLSRKGRPVWLCSCDCGNKHTVSGAILRDGRSRSCGCYLSDVNKRSSGINGKNWKGGRSRDGNGYIRLTVGPNQRIFEHIHIMETQLGRKLLPDEVVHHKNGIRSDNRIDNLELRVKSRHPMGASVDELLQWADELISRYRNH